MEDEGNVADYDEVLRVLPEAFQEKWKDNPDVLLYLTELGSCGLQTLSQESDRLAEEKNSILEQTQDLAFNNYKTFIHAADCSRTIFKDFNVIEDRLNAVATKLPIFKDKCVEFGKETQNINIRWRQASSTLSKHSQLLEILEIPQLMETYVKNEYYDEALELTNYVKLLEKKHSDLILIKSIQGEVKTLLNIMLRNLLTKLKTNIQLPDCLKVVGYLRRMDVFDESELRVKFLQARDLWFNKVISGIDKTDAYEHAIKVIENSRVHLFDIITQYRAIFSDDDSLILSRKDSKSSAIFYSWMTWKIQWFLSLLEKDISRDLGGRIDSILAQCMYFGLSFSRINIDFRPQLAPMFENIVMHSFKNSVERATYRFDKMMASFTFSSSSNPMVITVSEDLLQPPTSLLDFQPLAQYLNDILSAFNELKLCCSFSICTDVIKCITKSLENTVSCLVAVYNKWKNRLNDIETETFQRLCSLFVKDLVPHIDKCLFKIFPTENLLQALGLTSLEFKKVENVCKLNTECILEPLLFILSEKDEDIGLVMTVHEDTQEKSMAEQKDYTQIDKNVEICVESVEKSEDSSINETEIVVINEKELSQDYTEILSTVPEVDCSVPSNQEEKLL